VINPSDTFERAVRLHASGDLTGAEGMYTEVLSADPRHARAMHFLGVLAFQRGRPDEALRRIEESLRLDDTAPEMHNNLGVVHQHRGNFEVAETCYRRALQLDPRHGEALKGMGDVLALRGQPNASLEYYRAALTVLPRFVDAQQNLGMALQALGRWAEAEASFRRVLESQPGRIDTLLPLGDALNQQGRFNEACDVFRRAVETNPDSLPAYIKLSMVLQRLLRIDEAIDLMQTALRRGLDSAMLQVCLGDAFQLICRLEEAEVAYRKARQLDPLLKFAWAGLGMMCQIRGGFDEARECYDRAIQLDPEFGQGHFNLAALLLVQGDFARGWAEYAWRWKIPGAIEHKPEAGPPWDGAPNPKATVLLFGEQGLGDTLQFIRYVPLVHERVGRVVVECQPSLVPLLARIKEIDQLIPRGSPLPPCDAQAPLLTVASIVGTDLHTIPRNVPYLTADPQREARWREVLQQHPEFRVGVVWRGNPRHRLDKLRSFDALHLTALAAVPGVRLFSLQKGVGSGDVAKIAQRVPIVDLGPQIQDFEDTAAVLKNLDLLVCCDSAPAHLAGAMGLPVWMPLQYSPDWRWLLDREDTPWYPTMRLFRQAESDRWQPVFDRVAEELQALVKSTKKGHA